LAGPDRSVPLQLVRQWGHILGHLPSASKTDAPTLRSRDSALPSARRDVVAAGPYRPAARWSGLVARWTIGVGGQERGSPGFWPGLQGQFLIVAESVHFLTSLSIVPAKPLQRLPIHRMVSIVDVAIDHVHGEVFQSSADRLLVRFGNRLVFDQVDGSTDGY